MSMTPPPPPPPPPPGGGFPPGGTYPMGGALPTAPQNGLGIASLVLGILGVFCCGSFVMSVLAVVFGVMGRKKAEQGLATNGSIATAGLVLGIAGIVVSVIAVIYWLTVGMTTDFTTF